MPEVDDEVNLQSSQESVSMSVEWLAGDPSDKFNVGLSLHAAMLSCEELVEIYTKMSGGDA